VNNQSDTQNTDCTNEDPMVYAFRALGIKNFTLHKTTQYLQNLHYNQAILCISVFNDTAAWDVLENYGSSSSTAVSS
jgi:hypothetical protein